MLSLSTHRCPRRIWLIWAAAQLLTTIAYGQDTTTKPSVLFILTDDLRADAIGPYGNSVIRTPNLDCLARRGQCFSRAIVSYPVCVASRAEILAGCSSFRNGLMPNYSVELRSDLTTWPATMRDGGYRTVFTGKWHLPGRPHDHGYEQADALFAESRSHLAQTYPLDSQGRKVTGYVNWVF